MFQLARRLLISVWIGFESLPTTALDYKASWCLTLLVVVLGLVLAPSFWSVYLLTMARNQSLVSLFIPLHKFPPLLSNLTTAFSQPIPSLNIQMFLCFLTMKPFMTSVDAPLILSDPRTQTLTVSFLRYISIAFDSHECYHDKLVKIWGFVQCIVPILSIYKTFDTITD